ncbi:hypothetical protein JW933_04000 [candidate division FCPU426 bacterium]|nr:hypothetical protein [candidate division FCPU426 bacterium]
MKKILSVTMLILLLTPGSFMIPLMLVTGATHFIFRGFASGIEKKAFTSFHQHAAALMKPAQASSMAKSEGVHGKQAMSAMQTSPGKGRLSPEQPPARKKSGIRNLWKKAFHKTNRSKSRNI